MGMYTEIYVNVDFEKSTPKEVLDVIQAICNKDIESEHLTGKPGWWALLFNSGSYYTPNTEVGKLTYDELTQQYSLIGKGDIKNYKGEIEAFFDFICPWVVSEFMGYSRCEEDNLPTLMLKGERGE